MLERKPPVEFKESDLVCGWVGDEDATLVWLLEGSGDDDDKQELLLFETEPAVDLRWKKSVSLWLAELCELAVLLLLAIERSKRVGAMWPSLSTRMLGGRNERTMSRPNCCLKHPEQAVVPHDRTTK